LTLSPDFLESREDVNIHSNAGDHDHSGHEVVDDLFAGNALSDLNASGFDRNLAAGLGLGNWHRQTRIAGPDHTTLDTSFESELDAKLLAEHLLTEQLLAEQLQLLQPVDENAPRDLVPLARRKKWEQAIDELAAELPAAHDSHAVQALPRIAGR
jgi:hypothetical protein